MVKVSVVIPVYNAEKYLPRIAKELLTQTLMEMEFIFVNDCSKDGTKELLEEIEILAPDKVLVVHLEENTGAGGARNVGLQYAGGEYIGFVDVDDEIDPTMYEKLYLAATSRNAPVAECGIYIEQKDEAVLYVDDDAVEELTPGRRKDLIVSGGYVFNKIYRRDYFDTNPTPFRKKVILEDSEFIAHLYATVESIVTVKEILYIYHSNPNSLSKEKDADAYIFQLYEAIKAVYKSGSSLDNYEQLREAYEYAMLQMYCYACAMRMHAIVKKKPIDEKIFKELVQFRKKHITAGYDNVYVQKKICKEDIAAMVSADKSYKKY